MRIAMIGQKGAPARAGGIERHVEELAAELTSLGHEVLVYCRLWYTDGKKEQTCRGAMLRYTPCIRSKHLDAISHTLTSIWAAAREGVDVFHLHGVGPALLAWLPKLLRPSAKVVVTFHCIDRHHQKWGRIARWMLTLGERAACRLPDATITVSHTLQQHCQASHQTDTLHIPNGTQIPESAPDPSLLSNFNLQPNAYLLFCARLVKHKGAHVLMQAWKELKKNHPKLTEGMKLAIVGGGAFTDAYVEELQVLAKDETSIVMTGIQTGEPLQALFNHCYAMVHPSASEGLSIAILEAMSYGKCVLAADIPENAELMRHGGLSYAQADAQDLQQKLITLLQESELVQRVGQDARAYVAQHHDWKDIALTTSHLYDFLCFPPSLAIKKEIQK